ncbi:MAG: hypothetical protein M0Z77_01280 [Thermoplasmatales archaeon]|nr:hypothetical protein [Thermoplasmatales archaeon]
MDPKGFSSFRGLDITVSALVKELKSRTETDDILYKFISKKMNGESSDRRYIQKLTSKATKDFSEYLDESYIEINALEEIESRLNEVFQRDFSTILAALSITLIDNILTEWARVLGIPLVRRNEKGEEVFPKHGYTLLNEISTKLRVHGNDSPTLLKRVIFDDLWPLYQKEGLDLRNQIIHEGLNGKNIDMDYAIDLKGRLLRLIKAFEGD